MTATYKKGEIIWAKIQGYSWWPGRITQIKLKLYIKKDRYGKVVLQHDKEPIFYITFFPNDSVSKVRLKYMKKFIDGYKLRKGTTKRKKLNKAIEIAQKAFLRENPDLSMDIKREVFGVKLFSKKKFNLLKKFYALGEEEEDQNGENDIQSFIDSEINECEKYKNELQEKCKKNRFLGKKRKSEENKENFSSDIDKSSDDKKMDKKNELNRKFNKELKKYSNELYKANIEIKRKNTINNIISLFDNIDNIINNNDFDYNFNIIRDLLFIINNYSNHSNKSIMNRSISLHKNIICKYLDTFFNYNNSFLEKQKIYSESLFKNEDNILNNIIINETLKLCEDIAFQIDNIKNGNYNYNNNNILNEENTKIIKNENNLYNKAINDNKNFNNNDNDNNNLENINIYNINSELNDAITVNHDIDNEILKDKNNDLINNNKNGKVNIIDSSNNKLLSLNNNGPFLKDILNNPNYFNKKTEGQLYPDNFFNEIYLKGGINDKTELLRKKICLQLYNILKLVLPSCQEDIFKKNVIFLEYLARDVDPLFGNKYMTIINMIYNRIKSEAVKIKNKNKN